MNETTTKQTVYKDPLGATAWSNPIVLDSGGNLPSGGEVWFQEGLTYTVVFAPFTDSDPPTSPYWTKDNLSGINDVSQSSGLEWIAGTTPTFVSATSFTVVGDQTGTYTVGRRIKTTNAGGTVYSTVLASSFGAVTTVVVANDGSDTLDSGLSAVFYSILGTDQPSLPMIDIYACPDVRGRLTLLSRQPITTSDITSATNVIFTPYLGNTIDLYDGSANWRRFRFDEMSIAVPLSSAVYDVFAYQQTTGALALSTIAWTNISTRSVEISTQSGVYVQFGAATRLYLGSFFASTAAGTTSVLSTGAKRYLWNHWNRQKTELLRFGDVGSTFSWQLSTTAFGGTTRAANNNRENSVSFVIGLPQYVSASLRTASYAQPTGTSQLTVGFGLDAVTSFSLNSIRGMSANNSTEVKALSAAFGGVVTPGKHDLIWCEHAFGQTSTVVYGGNIANLNVQGIVGEFES
jgi:hypothetical protein